MSSFNLTQRLSSGVKLSQRGASMGDVATDRSRSDQSKKRRTIPGGVKPINTTKTLGNGFQRPQLSTNTVATVSPNPAPQRSARRKATPAHWDQGAAAERHKQEERQAATKRQRQTERDTATALAAVANTNDYEDGFEDDTEFAAAPATVRQSHPTNFSPAKRDTLRETERGSGGRWSTKQGDRTAEAGRYAAVARVTRSRSGGDDGVMWGGQSGRSNKRSAADRDREKDGAYTARYTPVEDSPSTKRAKEKQAQLKQQGNQYEEAITLSSDEENEAEAESEDEAGVVSFLLDDSKAFFGENTFAAAKTKIYFSSKGLQIPVQDVWGQGKDADVVPYEEIQSITTHNAGKHLWLSVVLESESEKLQSMPGMRKTKYSDPHKGRILLPLRASQSEAFDERCQRVNDEFIRTALVNDPEKFFVPARPHEVRDLLVGTPYQQRRMTRSASAVSSAADSDTLMVYYPDHGKSRVKITKADFNVLGEYEMLNDSAIDFYLKWIEHEVVMKSPGMVDRFLFFGTFFFKKMTTQIKAKLRGPTARLDRLASVEKYNSRGGESIWDRQFLIIPINEAFHWSLAVACIGPPEAQTEGETKRRPEAETEAPKPRKIDLLYFDSLGHKGRKHCKEIVEYLNYKWNKEYTADGSNPSVEYPYKMPPAVTTRSGGSASPTYECEEDGVSQVNLVQKHAPNQDNGHDCGVFLLEYAERFVKDIIFQTVRGSDCADYIGRSDFHEWFAPDAVKQKRTHMQQLLLHLERQRMVVEKQEADTERETERGKENIADGEADAAAAAAGNADADADADAPAEAAAETQKQRVIRVAGKEVPPPRQQVEVYMRHKTKSGWRQRSFVVPETEVETVQGTANLLQEVRSLFLLLLPPSPPPPLSLFLSLSELGVRARSSKLGLKTILGRISAMSGS